MVGVLRSSDFPTTIGVGQSSMSILGEDGINVNAFHTTTPVVPLTFLPILAAPGKLVFPTNNLSNLVQGVAYRILRVKGQAGTWSKIPTPTIPIRATYAGYIRKLLRHCPDVHPMTEDQYLNSCDSGRRARYSAVRDDLHKMRIRKPTQFVKLEPSDALVKEPVCRIITDPGVQYNYEIGMYIKPAEHAIMLGFEAMLGYKVIMKGMNAKELARDLRESWESFAQPASRSGDASRFDAHTGVEIRRDLEFPVYTGLFQSKSLGRLLNRGLVRDVVARARDGKFVYQLKSRGSGYHNTGIGNCIITSMMVLRYLVENKIYARLKVNGDDWFIIYDRNDSCKLAGMITYFLSHGYSMVMEAEVYDFEQIDFCQTSPIPIDGEWIMVRNPRKCRLKDLHTSMVRTDKTFRSWCSAVGESGLSMSSGVPILQEFYSCILRSALGAKPGHFFDKYSGRQQLSKGLTYKRKEVDSATRYSFWLAFGYTPDEQIALETEYLNSPPITFADLECFEQSSLIQMPTHALLEPSF